MNRNDRRIENRQQQKEAMKKQKHNKTQRREWRESQVDLDMLRNLPVDDAMDLLIDEIDHEEA